MNSNECTGKYFIPTSHVDSNAIDKLFLYSAENYFSSPNTLTAVKQEDYSSAMSGRTNRVFFSFGLDARRAQRALTQNQLRKEGNVAAKPQKIMIMSWIGLQYNRISGACG